MVTFKRIEKFWFVSETKIDNSFSGGHIEKYI